MVWVWKDDGEFQKPDDGQFQKPDDGQFQKPDVTSENGCSTRMIVQSRCRIEGMEDGKFLKRCQKIEQTLKDCVGRPPVVVESKKEFTEEDVTNQVVKGEGHFNFLGTPSSSEERHFNFPELEVELDSDIQATGSNFHSLFPGLRSDIEAIEQNLSHFADHLYEAAEDLRRGLFEAFGSCSRKEIPIGDGNPEKAGSEK